jgi:hypothetical protein
MSIGACAAVDCTRSVLWCRAYAPANMARLCKYYAGALRWDRAGRVWSGACQLPRGAFLLSLPGNHPPPGMLGGTRGGGETKLYRSPKGVNAPAGSKGTNIVRELTVALAHNQAVGPVHSFARPAPVAMPWLRHTLQAQRLCCL